MNGSTVRVLYVDGSFHVELNLAVRADGVYRCGFGKTPEAYEEAVVQLFEALDRAEALLKDKTYLVGDRLTEADIRLFVTIVRSGSPRASERVSSTNILSYPDTIRSRLCRPFQVQHSNYPSGLS